jgi:hypothetical protein
MKDTFLRHNISPLVNEQRQSVMIVTFEEPCILDEILIRNTLLIHLA